MSNSLNFTSRHHSSIWINSENSETFKSTIYLIIWRHIMVIYNHFHHLHFSPFAPFFLHTFVFEKILKVLFFEKYERFFFWKKCLSEFFCELRMWSWVDLWCPLRQLFFRVQKVGLNQGKVINCFWDFENYFLNYFLT